jgi:hypothetical protein
LGDFRSGHRINTIKSHNFHTKSAKSCNQLNSLFTQNSTFHQPCVAIFTKFQNLAGVFS